MTDSDIHICPHCGSDNLDVEHDYCETWLTSQDLPCSCGATLGPAATRSWNTTSYVTEWGPLQEDGVLYFEDSEEVEGDNDDAEVEIECQTCFDQAEESDWEPVEAEPVTFDPDEEKYRVVCRECEQEVPFEWDGRYINLLHEVKEEADQ